MCVCVCVCVCVGVGVGVVCVGVVLTIICGCVCAVGIQVRQDKTPFFMHHKFMLLDGHTLMTGSFNWTRQAIMGNNENLLITNHDDLVHAYSEEFEKLWQLFNPRNM